MKLKKNQIVTASILGLGIIASTSVQAEENKDNQEWFFKPYVGADIATLGVDYKTTDGISYGDVFADKFTDYNFHAGARVNKHLGLELGYTKSSTKSKNLGSTSVGGLGITGSTDIKFKGWNFDVLGYYPIDEAEKVELIGTLGVARWKADSKLNISSGTASTSYKDDITDTVLRAGLGAQYNVSDHVSARGMLRYMDVDFENSLSGAWSAGVGLNYTF